MSEAPLVSPHFTLQELMKTETGLPNEPDGEALSNLGITAGHLEEVRRLLGEPIIINSGYRSPQVNHAVRGVSTSAHCLGYAVDFTCPEFGNPFAVAATLSKSKIKFDQLIFEYGWVHISFDPRFRGECLTKKSAKAPYEHGLLA